MRTLAAIESKLTDLPLEDLHGTTHCARPRVQIASTNGGYVSPSDSILVALRTMCIPLQRRHIACTNDALSVFADTCDSGAVLHYGCGKDAAVPGAARARDCLGRSSWTAKMSASSRL